MTYKIDYLLKGKKQKINHCRYYKALNPETAVEMFKATCDSGSLTGENAELKAVYFRKENNTWQKV
tara:strand:+ start:345 stop:542 length:198 start_codon:yes stop_codon:yes gene_type:complete